MSEEQPCEVTDELPPKRRGRKPIYPLRDLQIGECLKIPLKKNIRQIISSTARQQGIAITTRLDLAEGVLKVWRK